METKACKEIPSERAKRRLDPRFGVMFPLYVVVIDTLIALFLTATGIAPRFVESFVLAQSYGICISSIVFLLHWIFKLKKGTAGHILVIAAGVCGGYPLGAVVGAAILKHVFSITLQPRGGDFLQAIALCLFFSVVVGYFFYSRGQLRAHQQVIEQERIIRLSSEKGALEANLRLLQAQIEPHFLFNTLSNVLSLIDSDPAKGKAMLSDLVRYLRTSLSRTRTAAATLEQEIDMVEAYLKIQKVRMGERLRFSIEVESGLKQHAFPPMLLQPLVENAVRHGLEPSVEGGEIAIAADVEGETLKVTVADTGCGFAAFEKGGVGIANVKERLRLLFGEKGRLTLEENSPHGVRAIIEAPSDAA